MMSVNLENASTRTVGIKNLVLVDSYSCNIASRSTQKSVCNCLLERTCNAIHQITIILHKMVKHEQTSKHLFTQIRTKLTESFHRLEKNLDRWQSCSKYSNTSVLIYRKALSAIQALFTLRSMNAIIVGPMRACGLAKLHVPYLQRSCRSDEQGLIKCKGDSLVEEIIQKCLHTNYWFLVIKPIQIEHVTVNVYTSSQTHARLSEIRLSKQKS